MIRLTKLTLPLLLAACLMRAAIITLPPNQINNANEPAGKFSISYTSDITETSSTSDTLTVVAPNNTYTCTLMQTDEPGLCAVQFLGLQWPANLAQAITETTTASDYYLRYNAVGSAVVAFCSDDENSNLPATCTTRYNQINPNNNAPPPVSETAGPFSDGPTAVAPEPSTAVPLLGALGVGVGILITRRRFKKSF